MLHGAGSGILRLAAAETVTQKKVGHQYATEHLNLALIMRLASEFQGFCRDLHDAAASTLASAVVGVDSVTGVLQGAFTRQRKLDRGNAGPGNIGNDFAILGMSFWSAVYEKYASRGQKWNDVLERLNKVRNAVAHSDAAELAVCRAEQLLTLATFRRWRRSLNTADAGFDTVVRAYLDSIEQDLREERVPTW